MVQERFQAESLAKAALSSFRLSSPSASSGPCTDVGVEGILQWAGLKAPGPPRTRSGHVLQLFAQEPLYLCPSELQRKQRRISCLQFGLCIFLLQHMEFPIPRQHIQASPLCQDIHHIIKHRAVGNELVAQVINIQDLLVRVLWISPSKLRSGAEKGKSERQA